MFFELISVIVAGFAGAGLALLARRLIPSLPRWTLPVCAGAAMLAVSIANEYGWYDRQTRTLPRGLIVVETRDNRAFWRPWTMLRPFTDRFTAIDRISKLTQPDLPDLRIFNLYYYARWSPVRRSTTVFDCAQNREALLTEGDSIAPDGTLTGSDWAPAGPAHPVACGP